MSTVLDRRTLAFIVPLKDAGKNFTLYIPMPDRARADLIAPILGHIFSVRQTSNFSPMVIARDYEFYAKEACTLAAQRINPADASRAADILFGQFKDFLTASITSAQVVDSNGKPLTILESKLSENAIDEAMGYYVFFYSVYRYAAMMLTESDTKDWLTSLTALEWATTSKTSLLETGSAGAKGTQ